MLKFYGKIFNLPPLAAKIYTFLIFDFERKGRTFEELVDTFSVSKSSVSTSLNLLINNNLINDLNKIDERKRYFTINHNFFKIRLIEIMSMLEEELYIIHELEHLNIEEIKLHKEKNKVYKALLQNNIKNIKESLTQL